MTVGERVQIGVEDAQRYADGASNSAARKMNQDAHRVQETMDYVEDKAREALHRFEGDGVGKIKLESVGHDMQRKGNEWKHKAEETVDSMGDKAEELAERIKNDLKHGERTASNMFAGAAKTEPSLHLQEEMMGKSRSDPESVPAVTCEDCTDKESKESNSQSSVESKATDMKGRITETLHHAAGKAQEMVEKVADDLTNGKRTESKIFTEANEIFNATPLWSSEVEELLMKTANYQQNNDASLGSSNGKQVAEAIRTPWITSTDFVLSTTLWIVVLTIGYYLYRENFPGKPTVSEDLRTFFKRVVALFKDLIHGTQQRYNNWARSTTHPNPVKYAMHEVHDLGMEVKKNAGNVVTEITQDFKEATEVAKEYIDQGKNAYHPETDDELDASIKPKLVQRQETAPATRP